MAALGSTRSKARARATLDDLLDTLKLLEQEPEPLPHPKAYHKDRYAWTDEVSGCQALMPPLKVRKPPWWVRKGTATMFVLQLRA